MTDPTTLWYHYSGRNPYSFQRLPTGSANYVFLIEDRRERFILRVADPAHRETLRGSVYWLDKLSLLNLPIPKLVANAVANETPYVVLTYLEGRDLGAVYGTLTAAQKRSIAHSLWDAQKKIAELPSDGAYGYRNSLEDQNGRATWKDVVVRHLKRSRDWMRQCGVFEESYVDRVESLLPEFDNFFAAVESRAFFDDATTKNLLIHEGRFSGIVDLDWICFGDRLYNLALIRMALLELNAPLDYVDYILKEEQPSGEARKALDFYTLCFCVDFMGGVGMQFNKAEKPIVTGRQKAQLIDIFWRLAASFRQ